MARVECGHEAAEVARVAKEAVRLHQEAELVRDVCEMCARCMQIVRRLRGM